MLDRLTKMLALIVGAVIGYGVYLLFNGVLNLAGVPLESILMPSAVTVIQVAFAIFFALSFFLLTPVFRKQTSRIAQELDESMRGVSSGEVLSASLGLVIGLVLAYLISNIYRMITVPYLPVILTVITYLIFAFLGIAIAIKRGNDISQMFTRTRRQETPSKSKGKGRQQMPKILDTSVIIDGRIADIMKTGFLEGNIVIPEFVLTELQHIADSSDNLKRNRGRRGLDVLNKIQTEYGIEIYSTASEKALDEIPEVDIKLLKLAQIMNGAVVTNDYNLNKVAAIKGVKVLNINELANTLKPVVLPGEEMTVYLIKEGREREQAIAYLDDGTMIVVEDGKKLIGRTVEVTVTSVLQTAAGRMIFAKTKRAL